MFESLGAMQLLERFQVPPGDMDFFALAAGGKGAAAIGRIIDAPQPDHVLKTFQLFPLRNIPHAHHTVIAAEEGLPAIRGNGDAGDAETVFVSWMVAVLQNLLGFKVKQPGPSLVAAGKRPSSIGGDCQTVNSLVLSWLLELKIGTGDFAASLDVPQSNRLVPPARDKLAAIRRKGHCKYMRGMTKGMNCLGRHRRFQADAHNLPAAALQ